MTLEEAVATLREECEGLETECAKCPIGQPLALMAFDAGVELRFTACGLLQMVEEALENPAEWKPER